MIVYVISMFSSILLKEHPDLILSFEKLPLYGTTSTQVPDNIIDVFFFFN